MPAAVSRRRFARGAAAAVLGGVVALALAGAAVPAPVVAAVVSQAAGRLVSSPAVGRDLVELVSSLQGARAVNGSDDTDVVVSTPLGSDAVAALRSLRSGPVALFGENGVVSLGSVGQWASADADGTSTAFAGSTGLAAELVGVRGALDPSPPLGRTAGAGLAVRLTSGLLREGVGDLEVVVRIGSFAAGAHRAADGSVLGVVALEDVSITIDGALLASVLLPLADDRPADVPAPPADGAVRITQPELLAAFGVTSLGALPPGTDLLSIVPALVVARYGSAFGDGGAGLERLLAERIAAIGSIDVNVRGDTGGAFTQTALVVRIGPAERAIAPVVLGSATVGPNGIGAAATGVRPATPWAPFVLAAAVGAAVGLLRARAERVAARAAPGPP